MQGSSTLEVDIATSRDLTCSECDKRASFGVRGRSATRCANHKSIDMIRLFGKECLSCTKYATHNYAGEKRAIRCSLHALRHMVRIDDYELCCVECCDKKPMYGYARRRAIYCEIHKSKNMVKSKQSVIINRYREIRRSRIKAIDELEQVVMNILTDNVV